jgi:hypothetical protein
MDRPCSRPASGKCWAGGIEDKEHAMSQKLDTSPAVIGIDIGKNSFHIVGQDRRGALVLRQKWSRGQVEARLANLPPCLIGNVSLMSAARVKRTYMRARASRNFSRSTFFLFLRFKRLA